MYILHCTVYAYVLFYVYTTLLTENRWLALGAHFTVNLNLRKIVVGVDCRQLQEFLRYILTVIIHTRLTDLPSELEIQR